MLLDTSGLIALHDADEPSHERAQISYRAATQRLTHNYVLAEFVAVAHARRLAKKRTPALRSARS